MKSGTLTQFVVFCRSPKQSRQLDCCGQHLMAAGRSNLSQLRIATTTVADTALGVLAIPPVSGPVWANSDLSSARDSLGVTRPTREFFVREGTVHLGGIQESAADGAMQGGDGFGVVCRALGLTHSHAAQTNG
jgi:hypothetical protein